MSEKATKGALETFENNFCCYQVLVRYIYKQPVMVILMGSTNNVFNLSVKDISE